MGNSSSSRRTTQSQLAESKSSKEEICISAGSEELILLIEDIYAEFDADRHDHKPKEKKIQVDTGHEYQYCYLDTRNNVMAYQTPQDQVRYGNLSTIWMLRDATDEKGNRAIYISNKVTDAANSNPPPGVPRTYLDPANQYQSDEYNLHTVGDGVKFYLEHDHSNKRNIAIYTHLSEEPIPSSDKYYLQLRKQDHSIVAVVESKVETSQRFIFQFRSA